MDETGCTRCDIHAACLIESLPAATLQRALARAAAEVPLGCSPQLRLFADTATGAQVLRRPRTADVMCDVFDQSRTPQGSSLYLARTLLTPWLPRSEGGTAAAFTQHTDGQGRLLVMLSALLTQLCQEGMDSAGLPDTHNGYSFFAPYTTTATHGEASEQQQRSRRRLTHTLRALTQRGAVCVRCKNKSNREEDDAGRDWWDVVLQATLHSLRAHEGDCVSLASEAGEVRWDDVRGVLYRVLSTEVDEEVAQRLCSLLVAYLTDHHMNDGVVQCSGSGGGACSALEVLRRRVRLLHEHPAQVFVCSSTAASMSSGPAQPGVEASRASRPPCPGPLPRSQLLPRHLCLLPTNTQGGSRSAAGMRTPLFHVRSEPSETEAGAEGGGHGAPLYVLLVRIDPTGDWLDAEETAYNTRTFVSYYYGSDDKEEEEKGGTWHGVRRRQRLRAMQRDSSDEDYAAMEARQTGTRRVLSRSGSEASLTEGAVQDQDEELMQRFIACLLCTGTSYAACSDPAMLQLRSTVRLYLWALRHRIHVILSPERAPPIMKNFGQRHLTLLRAFLTRSSKAEGDEQAHGTDDGSVSCSEVHDIFFVDELRLDSFRALQRTAAELRRSNRSGGSSDDGLARQGVVLLSRDALRVAAAGQAASEVALPVTRCVVTTPTDLFECATSVQDFLRHNRALLTSANDVRRRKSTARSNSNSETAVMRTAERICVLELYSTTPAPNASTPSEPRVQHADPLCSTPPPHTCTAASQLPPCRILLVAPSMAQVVQYEHLLRKCAATLHAVLQASSHGRGECIVVRAGGAFLVALARQLHLLAGKLDKDTLVLHGMTRAACDLSMVKYVLRSLAVACVAVPNKLAQSLLISCSSSSRISDCEMAEWVGQGVRRTRNVYDARCAGPRGRRRLWLSACAEALTGTASCSGDGNELCHGSPTLPTLHCYQLGLPDVLAREEEEEESDARVACDTRGLSDAALARRVFCADLQHQTGMSFVESLQDHVRLVFDVLDALRHIVCVAV